MTSGYGGWGWCSAIITAPATLLLWGGVVIAIILVVRSAVRRPSEPPAPRLMAGAMASWLHRSPQRTRQRRILPPADVAAREALSAKLIHRRHMIKVPRRSSHG